MVTKTLITAVLSVGAHLALGWEWTILAGVVGGLWSQRPSGWLVGAGGTALGWAVLAVYTAVVAPDSFRVLMDVLGTLAGNMPGEALVVLTVLLGGLLGGLGGGIGTMLCPLVEDRLSSDT